MCASARSRGARSRFPRRSSVAEGPGSVRARSGRRLSSVKVSLGVVVRDAGIPKSAGGDATRRASRREREGAGVATEGVTAPGIHGRGGEKHAASWGRRSRSSRMRCAPLRRARARFFPGMWHDAARVSASALRPPAARSVVAADGLRDPSTPPTDRRPARAPPPRAPTPPRAAPRPRTPATLRIITLRTTRTSRGARPVIPPHNVLAYFRSRYFLCGRALEAAGSTPADAVHPGSVPSLFFSRSAPPWSRRRTTRRISS